MNWRQLAGGLVVLAAVLLPFALYMAAPPKQPSLTDSLTEALTSPPLPASAASR